MNKLAYKIIRRIYRAIELPGFNDNFYNEKMLIVIFDGKLIFQDLGDYHDRKASMQTLIDELVITGKIDLTQNKRFLLNTADRPINWQGGIKKLDVLSFSTAPDYFDIPIPDFCYDHWNLVKLGPWETLTEQLILEGQKPYEINKAIWIGAPTHKIRKKVVRYFSWHKKEADMFIMKWTGKTTKYLSLFDQQKYKILIDLVAHGFSGRLKYFFFMNRPVIKYRDSYTLWYSQFLKPNENIMMVDNKSELLRTIRKLINDEILSKEIASNALMMSKKYLNKVNAMNYLAEAINNIKPILY